MLKHLKLKKQRRIEKKMRKLRNGQNSARGDFGGGNNSNGNNLTDNDLKNLNLITQAKQATTTAKHAHPSTRKRLSTDSAASEASLQASKLDLIDNDCSQAHQQQHTKMLVAPISNRNSSGSSPPMIVCLGVNGDANIDSENEIELGEVVRVDKIKNKVGFNELARDYDASGDALTPDPSPRPSTPVGFLAKSK